MHLLKYNPEAKTLTEVPPGEFDADPTCRYFYVLGKRAHVPIVTPDGIGQIVWQHPDYQPPSPANTMTETTYGSDITIPELSQSDVKAAEMEWARTAPGMRSDATDRVLALDAVAAAGAQVGRSSAAVDRVLALQDQIRDGSLTLADALKEINGEPIERTRRTTYLVERIKVKMIQEQKNSNSWQAVAEAVLREVAEWLRSEYPQREGFGSAAWANLIDNEANL